MTPHTSTSTRGHEAARDGVWFTDPGREPVVPATSVAGAAGWPSVGTWGLAATDNVTAAGVASSRRDWMVPVTSPASSATFQRRSEVAGSRRRRWVTSHATPRSTVLWIKYVRSHASRLEARALIWF